MFVYSDSLDHSQGFFKPIACLKESTLWSKEFPKETVAPNSLHFQPIHATFIFMWQQVRKNTIIKGI